MKKQPQNQPVIRKPRPRRVSMGELLYLCTTFQQLLEYAPAVVRQQISDTTESHCPTLFAAMHAWRATSTTGYAPEWDALTFTWNVPLPEAFQQDADASEGAVQ